MIHSIIPNAVSHWTRNKLAPVVMYLVKIKIRPAHLTWTGLAFSILAGLCAMKAKFLFAAIFAAFSGFMDILDGMVARESQTSSSRGAILDSAVDRYSDFFLLAGLVIRYKNFFINYYLGFLCLIGTFMVSYSQAKAVAAGVPIATDFMKRLDRWTILVVAMLFASLPPLGHIPIFLALFTIAIGTNYVAIQQFRLIGNQPFSKN